MTKAKRERGPLRPLLRGFLAAYMDAFSAAGREAPSLHEVAIAANSSRSAACRALSRLAELGYLRRVEYDHARPGLSRYLPREP